MARIQIRLSRAEWFFDDSRPLGKAGGFGEVFEGEGPAGNPVAIKRLNVTADKSAHRELEIARELAGRVFLHVLAPLDSGHDANSDCYFVVMPRADGSLEDEIIAKGELPLDEAVQVLWQIATGLLEIPEITHRDLKPGNVLRHGGSWKIADFGIARFVEETTSLNTLKNSLTPPYAAPEQWRLEHSTAATDAYALGCIAHRLLAGRTPFLGPALADFQKQHLTDPPPPLGAADPRLNGLIANCLRKPQAARPELKRVLALLAEVRSSPAKSIGALVDLQSASVIEAERIARLAAEAARAQAEKRERDELVAAAAVAFASILDGIDESVRGNAPESRIVRERGNRLTVYLGEQAVLDLQFEGAIPPNVVLNQCGWLPFAIGQVRVVQKGQNEWQHGATVWYMRQAPGTALRWHEASYKRHALLTGPSVGPFPIQDVGNDVYRHADLAAGPGMHTLELDSGPSPIDDEHQDAFVERWLGRLASAYNGRLRPF